MDFSEFEKRKRLPHVPLFAVLGDEPFLKRRSVAKILSSVARGPEGALGVRVADMEGPDELKPASIGEILSDVMTPSLFSQQTVVVVWRADRLLTPAGGEEALRAYLDRSGGTGTLVLELKSLDGRTRVGRAIREKGFVVECKRLFDRPPPWKGDVPLHDNPLARWIVAEGRREGLAFDLPLAQGLAERVGNDLGALHEEIVKLSLYKGSVKGAPGKVTENDLSASVGDYNEFGVFRLTDAVGDRDLRAALRITRGLFEQGLSAFGDGGKTGSGRIPVVLLDRIHAKMREIFRARAILDGGGSTERVGEVLKKHRAFLPRLVEEARRYPAARVSEILDAIFRAESRVKTRGGGR
ncbi:MAG: DNA polymerase III subunit delta, partial [Planctomycetota bacterium]